jgi:hypothetical protein
VTDARDEEVRGSRDASPREKPPRERKDRSHPHQAFDIGRLDNEVEAPKVLLDVIHIGVAVWGAILAAGVYFFGGRDWREALLVLGVFIFFLVVWRVAMFVGARRKASAKRRAAEADSATPNPYLERPKTTESS